MSKQHHHRRAGALKAASLLAILVRRQAVELCCNRAGAQPRVTHFRLCCSLAFLQATLLPVRAEDARSSPAPSLSSSSVSPVLEDRCLYPPCARAAANAAFQFLHAFELRWSASRSGARLPTPKRPRSLSAQGYLAVSVGPTASHHAECREFRLPDWAAGLLPRGRLPCRAPPLALVPPSSSPSPCWASNRSRISTLE